MKAMLFITFIIVFFITKSNQEPNPKYEKLEKWGSANGVEFGNIELIYSNSNDKYYVAKEDIAEGEKLLSIPQSLFFHKNITLSKKINSYLNKISNTNNTIFRDELTKEQVFNSIHLLKLVKSKQSKFFELYFDFFPSDLNNFPLLYDEEELKILRFTYFSSIVRFGRHTMEEELEFLKEQLNLNLDIEEYIYYRVLIVSRSFSINGLNTMIPFADLFKIHSKNFNIIWDYDQEKQVFTVKAIKQIKKAEVLNMPNRKASNALLLYFYGYTEEYNNHLEQLHVEILHPRFKQERGFNFTLYKSTMNIVDDNFAKENFELYKLVSNSYLFQKEFSGGYKLMLESLKYYAKDQGNINDSDYSAISNKINRENIKKVIKTENGLFDSRINFLKELIQRVQDSKKSDL